MKQLFGIIIIWTGWLLGDAVFSEINRGTLGELFLLTLGYSLSMWYYFIDKRKPRLEGN